MKEPYRLVARVLTALILGAVGAAISLVVFASLAPHAGAGFAAFVAFLLATLLFITTPVVRLIKAWIEAFVFRGRYDYKTSLEDAAREAASILDIDELASFVIEALKDCMPANHALLYLRNEEGAYRPHGWRGAAKKGPVPVLGPAHPFVKMIEVSGKGLILSDPDAHDAARADVFDDADVSMVVPILHKERLMGFMAIGPRKRFGGYTDQDLEIISLFGDAVGTALANALLYSEVVTDRLTRLCNRRYFMLRVSESIDCAKRYSYSVAVLIAEIDGFKKINERLGRIVGDMILRDVAGEIRRTCRVTDIVGRYGGDEFGILLPELDLASCQKIAERLRKRIEDLRPEGHSITLSIGIGYISAMEAGYCGSDIFRRAEDALKTAKAKGGNRVEGAGP